MKILFILENYYPNVGGLETLFKNLVEDLAQKGHEITIITNKTDPTSQIHERSGLVTILRYNFINRYLFSFLAIFPALPQAARHDLIHTTSYNAGLPAYLAALFTGKKCIITFHEVWSKLWFKLPYFSRLQSMSHFLFEKLLLELPFDRFVAVSNYTRDQLIHAGVRDDRITRIYNGIDYSKYQQHGAVTSPTFQFLYFGRLGISKGLDILLPSISILRKEIMNFQVTIVIPKKPLRLLRIIKNKVEELDISDLVDFQHNLSEHELQSLVHSSQAVVIPSYSEGFCFVAVETMALNIPIISSHQGALSEVVGGKHLAYAPQNDPGALAAAMLLAIKGQWKQTPTKRFPISKTVEDYLHLYNQLLEEVR